MSELLERLKQEIILYDGAMGTLLQEQGLLKPGMGPEVLNLTHADEIIGIHKQYVDAGANILETNTFGALRLKLAQYGLENKWKEINEAGVKNARSAAGKSAYVAAGIGPFEKMVHPLGPVSFEEAVTMYREWTEVIANAGPDLILFETFSDLKELKAAIIGAREVCDLPIQAQLTFGDEGRTITGTPPEVAAVVLSSLDVQIIGTNCSAGPKGLLPVAQKLCEYSSAYIAIQPNAGIPQLVNEKTVFLETPDEIARYVKKFIQSGVNILGGCCGTTPAHIVAIAREVKKKKPQKRRQQKRFCLASRTQFFEYNEKKRPVVIGERINPTGKKTLQAELKEGKTTSARRFAVEQTGRGAQLLDVNVGAAEVDEQKMMRQIVTAVQTVSDVPLVIDSVNPRVIEEGLKEFCGKALINSVSGEEKSLAAILPLAKKYGAAVLGLTTDKEGLAKTVEKRVAIARTIKERATAIGLPAKDIVIDPLTLTVSVEKEQVGYTLEAVKKIKDDLGLLTSLGVSNVSFGLPHRDIINAHFLSLAVRAGLDFCIINPGSEQMMQIVDKKAKGKSEYIKVKDIEVFIHESFDLQYKNMPKPEKKNITVSPETDIQSLLREAILLGDKENILDLVEVALKKGFAPLDISLKILIPAIEEVGKKFEAKEYFLPQIIMSAETMQTAIGRLNREMGTQDAAPKGEVIMATVEGDIHDIGKNIVIAVLESYGYKVYDLGRDVKKEEILSTVEKRKARIIGLSALMTTTMVNMEPVIAELKKQNGAIKVVVGGAAVTKDFAKKIGAAGYARDAIEAVKIINNYFER